MQAFRRDMEELKRSDPDIHLPKMNIDDLTSFDAVTWNKYQAKTLSITEFNQRRSEAVRGLKHDDSRTLLYAFMGNDWYDHFGAPQI